MKTVTGILTTLVCCAAFQNVAASDRTGVYAHIEQATIHNAGTTGETIVLRGVFATAVGRRWYNAPIRGYLYFKLKKGKEDVCRKEWADLKKLAGTNQCVSFGSRYKPIGRVRGLKEEPSSPEEYPLNFGVQKVRWTTYRPVDQIAHFPRPSGPKEHAVVARGRVKLTTGNILSSGKVTGYAFELRDAAGNVERSMLMAPGEKQTSWTPKTQIENGGRYTWRVWVVAERRIAGEMKEWKGPAAVAHFRGSRKR